jgi:hypothetical protein
MKQIIKHSVLRLVAQLVALAVLAEGCASGPDWGRRVGNYSYNDSVKELGPPDKKEALSDGTTVAEWLVSNARTFSTYYVTGRRQFFSSVDVTQTPSSYLRLTFGPDHKLTQFKRFWK